VVVGGCGWLWGGVTAATQPWAPLQRSACIMEAEHFTVQSDVISWRLASGSRNALLSPETAGCLKLLTSLLAFERGPLVLFIVMVFIMAWESVAPKLFFVQHPASIHIHALHPLDLGPAGEPGAVLGGLRLHVPHSSCMRPRSEGRHHPRRSATVASVLRRRGTALCCAPPMHHPAP
jgi:hypothetical protein